MQRLGAGVDQFAAAVCAAHPDIMEKLRVRAAWDAAVDPALNAHVTGLAFKHNTDNRELLVYVDSPILAADLGLQAEFLRMQLNFALVEEAAEAPEGALFEAAAVPEQILRIHFKVSREEYKRAVISAHEEPAAEPVPEPLTREEEISLLEACACIESAELRETAYKAVRDSLMMNKGLATAEKR